MSLDTNSILRKVIRIARHPNVAIGGAILLLLLFTAIAAPRLAPYNPFKQDLLQRRQPPTLKHPFGTDIYGRDMLSRIIVGSRASLEVGTISVVIGLVLGGICGMAAGYFGGVIDNLLMMLTDLLLVIPSLILALVVITALGPSLVNAMFAIGISFAPTYARLARSDTLVIRNKEYVESAAAVGCGSWRIMFRHVLPNILPNILIYSTLNVGAALLMEAALSFLGLGIQPPNPSWGGMINEGKDFLQMAPYLVTVPGLAIMLAVAGFNLFGEGLRDILDPRSRLHG